MTPQSLIIRRLMAWRAACEAYGYVIAASDIPDYETRRADGVIVVSAGKPGTNPDGSDTRSLTVRERWQAGDDPDNDHRLESDGCHLVSANWHLQVGLDGLPERAERLDAGPEDLDHPRIHQHPLGFPNSLRLPSELPPPTAWLNTTEALVELYLDPPAATDPVD